MWRFVFWLWICLLDVLTCVISFSSRRIVERTGRSRTAAPTVRALAKRLPMRANSTRAGSRAKARGWSHESPQRVMLMSVSRGRSDKSPWSSREIFGLETTWICSRYGKLMNSWLDISVTSGACSHSEAYQYPQFYLPGIQPYSDDLYTGCMTQTS